MVNLPTMITDQKAQVAKLEIENKRLTQVFPLARSLEEWEKSTEPKLSRELEELKNQMEILKGELEKQIQQRDFVEKRQSAVNKILVSKLQINKIKKYFQ